MFGRIVGDGGRGFGVDRDEQASAKRVLCKYWLRVEDETDSLGDSFNVTFLTGRLPPRSSY